MLFQLVLLLVAVANARIPNISEETSCSISLKDDLIPMKEPLIISSDHPLKSALDGHLQIQHPRVLNGSGVVPLRDGDKLMLACLGRRNEVRASGKQLAQLECDAGQLTVDGQPATKDLMACNSSYAWAWLERTNSTCEGSGQILQLGFKVADEFIPEVNICHDIAKGNTLYSRHLVLGQSLAGALKIDTRRKFTKGPKSLFPGVNPYSAYTRKAQNKTFDEILGKAAREKFLNDKIFLSRGHLAPDADWIYFSEQQMTYFYPNAAPQYLPFNAGNWVTVEKTVRRLAVAANVTVTVYTGTFGVLRLPDTEGQEKEIYLEPKKKLIPVPEVFWKLVQNPETEACTVAVGHNNVFLPEPPTPLCTTAAPGGWPTNLTDIALGYTYYCDYQSFAQVVKYAPHLQCNSLFVFPEIPQVIEELSD